MGDCLWTAKRSWYTCIPNTMVNSAFHPSGIGKSSTILSGWGMHVGCIQLCQVAGKTVCDPIWQVTLLCSETGFLWWAIYHFNTSYFCTESVTTILASVSFLFSS